MEKAFDLLFLVMRGITKDCLKACAQRSAGASDAEGESEAASLVDMTFALPVCSKTSMGKLGRPSCGLPCCGAPFSCVSVSDLDTFEGDTACPA